MLNISVTKKSTIHVLCNMPSYKTIVIEYCYRYETRFDDCKRRAWTISHMSSSDVCNFIGYRPTLIDQSYSSINCYSGKYERCPYSWAEYLTQTNLLTLKYVQVSLSIPFILLINLYLYLPVSFPNITLSFKHNLSPAWKENAETETPKSLKCKGFTGYQGNWKA